jgi:hypothetical protein
MNRHPAQAIAYTPSMTTALDRFGLFTVLREDKFRAEELAEAEHAGLSIATLADIRAAGIDPYDSVEAERNLMLNGGITTMLNLLIAAGGTSYANGNARICVGDGGGTVPTVAATDTTLVATSNRYNQATQGGSPTVSAQTVTFISVFASGNANFAWNEWGIDNGGASSGGAASGLLNHKGVALGTKTSASAWTATATITES